MMNSLLAPDAMHIGFAVIGAVFGYWLKRHPNVIPAELQPIVDLLMQRHAAAKQADAHDQLQTLSQPIASVVASAIDKVMSPPPTDIKAKG